MPKGRILYRARGKGFTKAHWFRDARDMVSACRRLDRTERPCERVPVVPGFLPSTMCIVCKDIMERVAREAKGPSMIERIFGKPPKA
jgi:hypothetical protein